VYYLVVDCFFGSIISLLDQCTISCRSLLVIVVLSFITSEQKKTIDRGQGESYDVTRKVKTMIHRKTCKSQKETHHVSLTKSVEEIELVKGQDFYSIRIKKDECQGEK
jgi:hypothetical protein